MILEGVGLMGTGGHTGDETADLRTLPVMAKRVGVLLARLHRGGYDASTVIPIASATKWLSGAVIMKLVDQNQISLDDPIRRFRSDFTGPAADITIRQLFSHTSGMVTNDPVTNDRSLTMEQAVAHLATLPLANPPGTALAYGSPSMHVAGRIAEQVTGRGFEQLFRDLIGTPLGMTSTDYQGFGPTTNYLIAGGVALLASAIAGYLPARKAASLHPVEIIRGAS